jgi:hypothetical protein
MIPYQETIGKEEDSVGLLSLVDIGACTRVITQLFQLIA